MKPTMEVRITVDKMADWLEKLLNAHLDDYDEPLTDYQRGVRKSEPSSRKCEPTSGHPRRT